MLRSHAIGSSPLQCTACQLGFLGALKSPWTTGATYIKSNGYWLASMQKICMPHHICFQKRWLPKRMWSNLCGREGCMPAVTESPCTRHPQHHGTKECALRTSLFPRKGCVFGGVFAQRAHSAGTAPIITVIIQVTTLKTTHLRNHAQLIQNSKIQTSDACHGSQGPKFCPL